MVMRADVLAAALDAVIAVDDRRPRLSMTPRGVPFAQAAARELAAGQGVIIVCGRFEGVDERVIEARGLREVSIGDFVLAGGEIAAMAIIESSSGFCRASWARKPPAKKRASSTVSSNIRIIPARANGRAAPFPRFCSPAIMPASKPGAAPKQNDTRASGARIYSTRRQYGARNSRSEHGVMA